MKILAISGSLRAASINSALLRAAARLAPEGMALRLFGGLGDLPLFNPDIEASDPAPVRLFRAQLREADALLFASPEYAHGVTGALKNGLDWMVGSDVFVDKPVAVFNASPMSVHAHASLIETLGVMSARLLAKACIELPLRGARLDEDGIVADAGMAAALRRGLDTLALELRAVSGKSHGD